MNSVQTGGKSVKSAGGRAGRCCICAWALILQRPGGELLCNVKMSMPESHWRRREDSFSFWMGFFFSMKMFYIWLWINTVRLQSASRKHTHTNEKPQLHSFPHKHSVMRNFCHSSWGAQNASVSHCVSPRKNHTHTALPLFWLDTSPIVGTLEVVIFTITRFLFSNKHADSTWKSKAEIFTVMCFAITMIFFLIGNQMWCNR